MSVSGFTRGNFFLNTIKIKQISCVKVFIQKARLTGILIKVHIQTYFADYIYLQICFYMYLI